MEEKKSYVCADFNYDDNGYLMYKNGAAWEEEDKKNNVNHQLNKKENDVSVVVGQGGVGKFGNQNQVKSGNNDEVSQLPNIDEILIPDMKPPLILAAS